MVALLTQLGYEKQEMAGSRVRFTHPTRPMILLHRPHPENSPARRRVEDAQGTDLGELKPMIYLEYKGYLGTIEAELEDDTLFGKLAFVRDLVTYEANDLGGLRREFEQSVDAYLTSCAELGRAPDTPFKGTFNVRVSPEIHRKAAMLAGERSLNAFVAEALADARTAT
ncbi:MAG: hypothetical protein B7Y40_05515 [Gammaproteobacteria bacterium 28-57-27]|nr:MAG: hypothetical protein B7Y40_05515 [Gammaproteobacteria bacterium 28-57-27]